jgi:hypothetical protein
MSIFIKIKIKISPKFTGALPGRDYINGNNSILVFYHLRYIEVQTEWLGFNTDISSGVLRSAFKEVH